jgi:hypothetical protein
MFQYMSEEEAALYKEVLMKHFSGLFSEDVLTRMLRERIGS